MKKLTYSQALEELQRILEELESQQVDVDALSERVKRAAFLIEWCQTRLKKTETEVKKVLMEMEKEETEKEESPEKSS